MVGDRGFGLVLARVRYRVGQGLTYLRAPRSDMLDARLRELLRPTEFELISRLSRADRAHHLEVHARLLERGCSDRDLLEAALLHDVGKVELDTRVGLIDRSLAVLIGVASPRLLKVLARPDGRRWRRGFFLVLHHPEAGAWLAYGAGCNERVCWLIAHHHDFEPSDAELKLLQWADDGGAR